MSTRPSRRSSSSSSIVPWSMVSGVRSSCEAVETNERRADSWRRSASCMLASARARSPTSSRPSSRGDGASGPSAVIRSAEARRRASRRSSVLESATPSSAATSIPTPAATSSALRTWTTAVVTSVSRRWATSAPTSPSSRVKSGTATLTSSPLTWITRSPRRCARSATSRASSGGSPVSVSMKKPSVTASVGSSSSGVGRVSDRLATSTRASVRSRSSRASLPTANRSPGRSGQDASNPGRAASTASSRLSVLCSRSCSRSGPSRTPVTTARVSPLVTTKASSSRPRRPRGMSLLLMARGSGTRAPAPSGSGSAPPGAPRASRAGGGCGRRSPAGRGTRCRPRSSAAAPAG